MSPKQALMLKAAPAAPRSSSADMIAVPRDTLQFVYDIVDIVGCVPGPTDAEGERHLEVLRSALSASTEQDDLHDPHERPGDVDRS